VRYSKLAAAQSEEQAAWDVAARHYRAALSIREGDEIDDEMADLLYRLSMAASATLQTSDAWRSARQAFDYYANAGNVAKAVDVAYFAGTNGGFVRPSQTQLIERALALVKENSEDFGRLSVALGFSAGFLGDEQRAQEAFARADEVAQRLGLKRLEFDGVLFGLEGSFYHMHIDATAEMGERAVALARELDLPRGEYQAHFIAAVSLRWAGDLEAARRHADACRELAERLRELPAIAGATHVQAATAILRGDWESALTYLTRGLEIAPRDIRLLCNAALVASVEGDSSAAADYVDRMLETMSATPPGPSLAFAFPAMFLPRIALITGRPLDNDVVDHAARAVLESPVAGVSRFKAHVRLGLAIQAVLANDQTAAEAALLNTDDRFTGVGDSLIHTDHIRGLLLDTLGRADEAVAACDSALDFLKDGYDPIRAEVLYDSARIRLKRAAPSDYEQALALNNQALDLAQKLGMKPLIERIIATKLKLQGITSGDIKTSIDVVAATVLADRPDVSSHAAPDGTVTIMFTDIVGSTPLNERLGDKRWMELLKEHNVIIREQISAHDGYEVKTEGDGFMLAFASARKAVDCAIEIQRAFAARNDGADEPVLVRIGLHTGEPVQENNDFYGTQVTQAARIGNEANGGEILVSALLRELTQAGGDIAFGEARDMDLKGLGKQRVFQVEWSS
jgi:class 3 adenylate cyclase